MKEITIKMHIFPEKLKALMRARNMSAVRISEDGIYSEKTIRRAIKSGVATADLVSYLSYRLSTDPKNFADVDKYFNELERFIYDWKSFKEGKLEKRFSEQPSHAVRKRIKRIIVGDPKSLPYIKAYQKILREEVKKDDKD